MKFFEVADLSAVVVIADDRRRQGGKKTIYTYIARQGPRERHRQPQGQRQRSWLSRRQRCSTSTPFGLFLVNSLRESLKYVTVWQVITYLGSESQDNSSHVVRLCHDDDDPSLRRHHGNMRFTNLMMLSSSYSIFFQTFWRRQILRWKSLSRNPGLWRQVSRLQLYVCMDLESFADLVLAFFENGEFDSTNSAVSDFNVELIVARTTPYFKRSA